MRRGQVLFIIALLMMAVPENNAQVLRTSKTQRIKVWYPLPAHLEAVSNAGSQGRTLPRHDNTPTSKSQAGYYIEVDTTRDGTHMTFMVTTTVDTGVGSLLKAIMDANSNPGLDYIHFSIGSGPQTLAPNFAQGLPLIMSPVVIDGTTQPGFSGTPFIELNGSNLGSIPGLVIVAGNSTVRGLVINRCQHSAIQLTSGGNNIIERNSIGTNIAGSDSLPNLGYGIHILNSSGNRIGNRLFPERNTIAGNRFPHIMVEGPGSTGNTVLGNYIGTDRSGLSDLSGQTNGVLITDGASGNSIGGLQFGDGNVISGNEYPNIAIRSAGSSNNIVQGNTIGTGWNGFPVMENGNGIYILNGASNNLIGHTTTAGRNIISGSVDPSPGLVLEGSTTTNNVVQGNLIGSPQGRDYPFGNADGIVIINAPNNTIGGTLVGAGNQIRGNRRHGVGISGSLASGNRVEGNLIGDPFIPLVLRGPANLGSGVFIQNAPGNVIGGFDPLTRNKISANGQDGIVIRGDTATGNLIQGNLIGDDGNGVFGSDNRGNGGHGVLLIASSNSIGGNNPFLGNIIGYNKGSGVYDSAGSNELIRFNSIFSNDSLGIDLAPHGITYNDLLDVDEGPNGLQNFPILDSAAISPGSIRILGRLDSKPGTTYTLDFFRNDKRDRTFFGEGQTSIGSSTVTTTSAGSIDFNVTFPATVADSQFITATAIDPNGNTSEFSRALCMRDRDGDGILDCWETQGDGIDVNVDGIIDLNLYDKGARSDHKDIFVEVDHMNARRPSDSAFSMVSSAFAGVSNFLLHNPDGNDGIDLHIEFDTTDVLTLALWGVNPWPDFLAAKEQHFGTVAERADTNILRAKALVYRYCIFANAFGSSSSGMARIIPGNPGNDFFVSLGAWGVARRNDPRVQAGTFMHELGHTLGLQHGGGDGVHYKPNYYSVMNYAWQCPQTVSAQDTLSWNLVFSPTQLPTLGETSLSESFGLGLMASVYPVVKIPYFRPNGTYAQALLRVNTSVDWDGNGDSSGLALVPVDVNHLDPANPASPGETLYGYADWPNLQYNFRNVPGVFARDAVDTLVYNEMTEEIYNHLLTLPPYGVISPLIHWPSDPNLNIPISTAPVTQGPPLVAGDGEGGAYITWSHSPGFPSPTSVWAQRVDAFGALQWMNNGVPVAIGPDVQITMDIIPDGEGNAIITWYARRTGSYDIKIQKINRFGQGLWTTNGVSIATVVNDARTPWPKLTSDGQGGAIIVWMETHSGSGYIYAQRIGASGDIQWIPGGVLINSTGHNPDEFKVAKDATGGIIIAWTDTRGGIGNGDIYAQRVSASGLVQWTTNGVRICDASGDQREPVLVSNGVGGAIVAWRDFRTGQDNIYAQHVDSSGQTLWTTNGIVVVSGSGLRSYCRIVTDGSHGAILSWLDERRVGGYRDAYVQRVNSAGVAMWTANGVAISDTNLKCNESAIISNNNGGAVVVLARQGVFAGVESHIFAQLIDSTGSTVWARNGVPITLANGTQLTPSATSNLAGGAIIAWRDSRNTPLNSGNRHIYAQNVTSSGGLGGGVTTGVDQSPSGEVPSEATLWQNYPNPFNPRTTIRYTLPERSIVSLKIYNILGQEVATLVNGIEEPGGRQTQFNANNMASGVYFYRLITTAVGSNAPFTTVKKMMLIR